MQKYIEIVFTYNWDAWPRSLLFYTVSIKYPGELINALGLLRNSGFFHEPGAFSLYLMLAIIINTFFTRNTLDKKNIILAIILLTTFSTAGYIILALFLAYAIPKSKMHPVLKYLVLFIMILVTINTYRTEDFLKSKIEEHYSTQVESIQENEVSGGRFYSFLKAYEVIKQYPVFGKGIITKNRPVEEGAYYDWGPMGLFANYGIIFGFIYLLFYYKGLEKLRLLFGLPKGIAILFLIIIQAGLSTQAFFFHASFVMFFIIGLESNVNPRASIIPEKPMAYKTPIVSKGI
ncbi:MAG: hypothetical protein NTV31_00380 [Bacteroidia bacterium]|nr:hypothetical protein [Bacteroidia bacterium]